MSETTLRVKTQADIAALKAYRQELVLFTAAIRDAGAAMRESGGGLPSAGGSAGPSAPGSSAPGAPLPAPTAPAPMAPAPPPTAPPPSEGPGQGSLPAPPPVAPPTATVGPPTQVAGPPQQQGGFGRQMLGYMGVAGATAVGLGLGSSIAGFLLSSGSKFLELSKVIAQIDARFRGAGDSVAYFGHSMGYTIGETAGLVEALGNVRDRADRSEFTRYGGFARYTGLDPRQAMGTFGRLSTLQGSTVSSGQLAEILKRAEASGMGHGRLGEFLSILETMGQGQFGATGQLDLRALMATQSVPGLAFGANDPRAQGQQGLGLMEGLNQSLTGNPAMQTFMMRAMGFGAAGGPGYIEMRKRLSAGVYDPRNIRDLFQAFQARGMSKPAMFRALESVSGGSLAPWQIEGLVNSLGDPAGLSQLQGQMDMPAASAGSGQEPDWARLGRGAVGMGSWREVQIEGMQMKVGETVATVMMDMTDVMISLVKTGENLLGLDLGTSIKELSGSLKDAAGAIEKMTRPGSQLMGGYVEDSVSDSTAKTVIDILSVPLPQPSRSGAVRFAPGDGNEWSNGGGGQSP